MKTIKSKNSNEIQIATKGVLKELTTLIGDSFVFEIDGSPIISNSPLTGTIISRNNAGLKGVTSGIILSAAYKSEKISGSSSKHTINLIEKIYSLYCSQERGDKSSSMISNELNCITNIILGLINRSSYRANLNNLNAFLKTRHGLKEFNILKTVIDKSGLEGKIFVEHKDVKIPIVEISSGYEFDCEPDPNVLSYCENNTWENENVKVLVVDGFVEKVSEIDNILNYCVKNKKPLMMIARGYAQEVISTLVTNKARGTLDVLPVSIKIDESSLNTMADIAISCGSEMLSSLKGDLITSIDPDELVSVDKVISSNFNVNISNKSSIKSVNNHLNNLYERRHKQENLSDMFDDRIKCLTSHKVRIIFPKAGNKNDIIQNERFDITLRTLKSIMSYGFIDIKLFNRLVQESMLAEDLKLILKDLINNNKNKPTLSLFSSIKVGMSACENLLSIEKAIIFDE